VGVTTAVTSAVSVAVTGAPPVVGGVLLGMEQAGLAFTTARLRLLDSAESMSKPVVHE